MKNQLISLKSAALLMLALMLLAWTGACKSPTGPDPDPPPQAVVTLVDDINSGLGDSSPANFAVFSNILYFSADDGTDGIELWKYDGSTTALVDDINSGLGDSSPANLTVYNNILYFSADDGSTGNELWKYDGVSSPSPVTDINQAPDTGNANPSFLKVYGTNLYFSAKQTSASANSLFKHDGTNTNPVTSLNNPLHLAVYGGLLYFGAFDLPANGQELWTYNGTTETLAEDINSSGSSFPSFFAEYNTELYFQADDGSGIKLWKYDGSNLNVIVNNSGTTNPRYLTVFNSKLYFKANRAGYGTELFAYDSVADATTMIEINVGAGSGLDPNTNMIVYDGELYFAATDGTGFKLWKYDGNTKSVAASGLTVPTASTTSYFAVYNNKLYFQADDGTNGMELWELHY